MTTTKKKSLLWAVTVLGLAVMGVGFFAVVLALPAYLALSTVLDPETFWERFTLFAALALFAQRAAEKAAAWGVQSLLSASLKDALLGGLKEAMSRGPQGCEEALKTLRAAQGSRTLDS